MKVKVSPAAGILLSTASWKIYRILLRLVYLHETINAQHVVDRPTASCILAQQRKNLLCASWRSSSVQRLITYIQVRVVAGCRVSGVSPPRLSGCRSKSPWSTGARYPGTPGTQHASNLPQSIVVDGTTTEYYRTYDYILLLLLL